MRLRNIAAAPVVFLVRVPLFALGAALIWAGDKLQWLATKLPALEKPL